MEENQPRLIPETRDEFIVKKLKSFGLPITLKTIMKDLLDGRRKASHFICCNCNCLTCNSTIVKCYKNIDEEWTNRN